MFLLFWIASKTAQEAPKRPQDPLKRLQEAAKRVPGGPKRSPRHRRSRSRGLKTHRHAPNGLNMPTQSKPVLGKQNSVQEDMQ